MKVFLGLCLIAIAATALAADRITEVTIAGETYRHISDVHVTAAGRIAILYGVGGLTVAPDDLPPGFLESWGVDPNKVAAATNAPNASASGWLKQQEEEALNRALAAGLIRKVDDVIYDLRKQPAGWEQINHAKVVTMTTDSAVVDLTPDQSKRTLVLILNLPSSAIEHDQVSVLAKLISTSASSPAKGPQPDRTYDYGHICSRNEIPPEGLSASSGHGGELSAAGIPDFDKLHATGSGFFVTDDGYLFTNNHVVDGADKVKVKYRDEILNAEVIKTDRENDVALLKVAGHDFKPLAISDAPEADLGEDVFTIGFPNPQVQGMEPKLTAGKISSLSGVHDELGKYQISVPVQPGNSGGPLCDGRGEMVGIIVARLNDMAILHSSGSLPQNVNYAVKAKYARALLDDALPGRKLLKPEPPQTPSALFLGVKDTIVMVLNYRQ